MSAAASQVGRFFKHSGIYAAGSALNRLGAFMLLPIYTRLLSTGEYGAVETLYIVSGLISGILGVGIAHATLRFYFDYKEEADRRAVISTNLIASVVLAGVGVLPLLAASDWLTGMIFRGVDIGSAFKWMLASIALELGSQVGLAYIRAVERSVVFIAVSLAKLVVQVIANSIALLYFHAGVEGVMLGNFLTVAMGFVVLTTLAVRHCGWRFDRDKLRPVLRYSFPFLLTTLVGIASGASDRILLQGLMSLEALGIYALATKFAKLISDLVGEPVNRAYGSFRFTIMERDDAAAIQADVLRYLAVLLSLAGLVVILFARDVLVLMAAPAYWSAARYMPPLVLAAILQVLVYPLQTGIFYQKRSPDLFRVSLAQMVVATGLGAALVWTLGIWGACLSVLAVAVVSVVYTDRLSQRYFRVRYPLARLFVLFLLLASAAAIGQAADHVLPGWQAIGVKLLVLFSFCLGLVATRVVAPVEVARTGRWIGRRKVAA